MRENFKRNQFGSEISKEHIQDNVQQINEEGKEIGEEYDHREKNAEAVSQALQQLSDTVSEGKESRLEANKGFAQEGEKMKNEADQVEEQFHQANEIPKNDLAEKISTEDQNEQTLNEVKGNLHEAGFDEGFLEEKIRNSEINKEDFGNYTQDIQKTDEELRETNQQTFDNLRDAVSKLE